jgi:hypothetical protein
MGRFSARFPFAEGRVTSTPSRPANPRLQRTRVRAPLSRKPFGVAWLIAR